MRSPRQKGHRALIWALAIALLLTVGVGVAIALSSSPEPRIMAPGPHYFNEGPSETTDGGS